MKRVLVALSLSLLLLGCERLTEKLGEKIAEKAVENAGGGDVKVETSSGGVTVTDKKTGTTVQNGTTTKLPDGWPATFPMYPGAVVRSAISSTTGKNVTLVTNDPPAKVFAFYKASGLKVENEMDLGSQKMLGLKHGGESATLMISQASGDTMVSITLTD